MLVNAEDRNCPSMFNCGLLSWRTMAGQSVSGKANATTAMGAMIFFWARLAYAVIYLIGIPWLRTLVWFVSVIGMAMIAWVLLQAM